MGHGGKRDGAGRKPGGKNRRTVEIEKAMQAVVAEFEAQHPNLFAGDGVTLLQTVYKNPDVPWDVRVDAAKAAAPFERPKLVAAAVRDVTPDKRDPSSRNARIMELLEKGLAGGAVAVIEG